jgi:phosphopantothenoylcysteine decarboxylase/phosphopantothenate--cysteine ligase|tara:strand:- start:140 stop:1339 length:1200 start_codon:yes stop_codon:yes gene_type:complete
MNNLENKKILLIICGGIAAYKSLELIRLLKKKGSLVKTILTKNSQKFITPLSVSSLSQEKIYSDLFDHENEAEMDHISLSRWADLILIAPATANTISKLSYGLADDLASTVCLASNKKILLVPSMNVRMWEHKTNKENINKLKSLNYGIIGPEIGDMACGEYGEGKMTEPKEIINYLSSYFKNISNNKKYKALVTAGPTCEFIDPVRFISNKSSGKQGYELANSLKNNGFETILISGPTNQQDVEGVKMIKVNSAKEMYDATMDNLPVDIAIFSAAVSDWKIENFNKEKIKKNGDLNLSLVQNIDILSNISKNNSLRPKLVIGFAAETDNLVENSKKKLDEKNCDWIIANDVSNNEIGFDSDYNEITIFYRNKNLEKISKMKKSLIADKIVERVISDLN